MRFFLLGLHDGHSFLDQVIHRFRSRHPGVTLGFSDLIPAAILQSVAQRTADVGFLRGIFPHDELAVEELGAEPMIVIMPKDHRLTKKKVLEGEDLTEESFVMVPDEGAMGYNDIIRSYCREHGFMPRLCAEGNQLQTVIWLVHVGLGLALIPESLKCLHRENTTYRELKDPPHITAKMVYRRDNESPMLANFIAVVRDCVAEPRAPVRQDVKSPRPRRFNQAVET